jgi:hypothetical protein
MGRKALPNPDSTLHGLLGPTKTTPDLQQKRGSSTAQPAGTDGSVKGRPLPFTNARSSRSYTSKSWKHWSPVEEAQRIPCAIHLCPVYTAQYPHCSVRPVGPQEQRRPGSNLAALPREPEWQTEAAVDGTACRTCGWV